VESGDSITLRLAFVGKGGAGKSAIAGTFVRSMAQRGREVLAVDSDPMPGLALSLGLPSIDAGIPDDATEESPEGSEGPRYRLRAGLDAMAAVDEYAAVGPDGVRFLQFGKLRGHVSSSMRSQLAFRQIVGELPDDRWNVIGDLPGGTRQPFFGWGRFAHTVVIVAEPTAASLLSARRLTRLALDRAAPERLVAVANKVRSAGDADMVADRTGLEVIGSVPWDLAFADAEQRGLAPIDGAPDCPAVRAVRSLVEQLLGEGAPS
jgi:CO dehydrogenase maturation factor